MSIPGFSAEASIDTPKNRMLWARVVSDRKTSDEFQRRAFCKNYRLMGVMAEAMMAEAVMAEAMMAVTPIVVGTLTSIVFTIA
jgi:hypothetical protein